MVWAETQSNVASRSVVVSGVVKRSAHAIDNEGWDEMGHWARGIRERGPGSLQGNGVIGLGVGWDEVQVGIENLANMLFVRLATR